MTTETGQTQTGETGNQTGSQSGQQQQTSQTGQTGNQTGQTGVVFSQEQQDHINGLLKREREEATKKAKADLDAAQQKAAQEAEEKRLKEQAEWQKLAETHEAKARELEPQVTTLSEKVTAYEAVIVELLEARIKALGDAAKTAVANLPGEPDTLAKLKWLNANESLFKQALGPGNQTKPKPVPAGTLPQGAQQMTPAQNIVRF